MGIVLELLTGGWNLIKMGFTALGNFLKSLNAQGVCGLLVSLALAFLAFHEWSEARHWHKQSNQYQALYTAEQKTLEETVANYRNAAAQAEASDKANAARVKAQQDQISKEQSDDYETRLAAARAEYQRLRGASTANPGSSASSAVSVVPDAAGGPDGAAGQDELSDRYICTAQSIQLDALIKWNAKQASVDVNGKQ